MRKDKRMAVCQFKHRFHFLVAFAFVTNLLCPVTRAIGQIPQNRTKAKNFTVTDAISMAMKQSAVIKQYEAKLQAANEKLKVKKSTMAVLTAAVKSLLKCKLYKYFHLLKC